MKQELLELIKTRLNKVGLDVGELNIDLARIGVMQSSTTYAGQFKTTDVEKQKLVIKTEFDRLIDELKQINHLI